MFFWRCLKVKVPFLENGPEPGLLSEGRNYSQGGEITLRGGVGLRGRGYSKGLTFFYKVIIYKV
jgi:hypothetical protein